MPLDPQAKAFIDQLAAVGGPPLHERTLEQVRAMSFAPFGVAIEELARVEDRTLQSLDVQFAYEFLDPATRMDALFLIDRDARERGLNPQERLRHRGEYAAEWLRGIHDSCLMLATEALPKSALGQAVTYTLNMWQKLRRCFDYAEVELSNNLAENSMRPVALGRKNWLHVGSTQAGPKVAAILSVVESCRRLGVPIKKYLAAILPGLSNRTLSKTAQLTPARWSASAAGTTE